MRARSSGQPLAPRLCGLPEVPAELRDIPGDAVVGVMAYELRGQPFPLVHQRLMAVVPTPVVDRDQRASEPARGPPLARLSPSRYALNRSLRFPDLRTGEDSPLRTTFRHSNRKISPSQSLPTPRRPRSGRSDTFPTRSPRSVVRWPLRLQRPFRDARAACAAFRAARDGIYDTVVLRPTGLCQWCVSVAPEPTVDWL